LPLGSFLVKWRRCPPEAGGGQSSFLIFFVPIFIPVFPAPLNLSDLDPADGVHDVDRRQQTQPPSALPANNFINHSDQAAQF